jgi:hypothetical protein
MKRYLPWTLMVLLLVVVAADSALAFGHGPIVGPSRCGARRYAARNSWHGGYYHSAWGMPVALVVPPTAEFQTHWGWGVGNTRITPIWHQFQRNYPGPGFYERGSVRPTPPWPSDTDQFGVYYIRGPW